MTKKFKLEYLSKRHTKNGIYSVWMVSVVKANNPFDAIDKFRVKHPGKFPTFIHEIDATGKSIKYWTIDKLNANREKILVDYDLS